MRIAGDAMAVPVLVRLLATLPESPGAWPPLKLACTDGGLKVVPEEAESSTEAAGGKWSVQAQDSVVHDATTADVYVSDSTYSHTLPRIHIRMDSRTQEKRRQSDSDERIPAC